MSVLLPAYANVETPYYVPADVGRPILSIFTVSGTTPATIFDFARKTTNFPPGVFSTVNVNWQDGNQGGAGIMGQACVFVNASGIPNFGSYATTFNETGVTAVTMGISGSALICTCTGKSTSTPGTALIMPVPITIT